MAVSSASRAQWGRTGSSQQFQTLKPSSAPFELFRSPRFRMAHHITINLNDPITIPPPDQQDNPWQDTTPPSTASTHSEPPPAPVCFRCRRNYANFRCLHCAQPVCGQWPCYWAVCRVCHSGNQCSRCAGACHDLHLISRWMQWWWYKV